MKLSFSNGIFSKLGLQKNFETVQALGFSNIEFNMKCVRRENDVAVYGTKKLLETCVLNCLTVHSATLHVKDEVEIHRAVYYGKISLEFAKQLCAPIMTVHSDISKKLPQTTRHRCLSGIFDDLTKYAKQLGVKLALENLSYTSTGYGKNPEQLNEILSVIDDGSMGITLDFCHALETKQVDALLESYRDRICNVHMANRAHVPFTEKTAELTDFLSKMRHYNYEGPITIEIAHDTSMQEIQKTKNFFEKQLTK